MRADEGEEQKEVWNSKKSYKKFKGDYQKCGWHRHKSVDCYAMTMVRRMKMPEVT
jgi:hypothetical protein